MTERTVYSYRSWRRFFRALFWCTLGPLVVANAVSDAVSRRPIHETVFDPNLFRWTVAITMFVMCAFELTKTLGFLFERYVLEGSTLIYYNWIGQRKMSVEVSDVTSLALGGPPGVRTSFIPPSTRWEVETRIGCVFFSEELKNYKDLIERLRASGVPVGYVRGSL